VPCADGMFCNYANEVWDDINGRWSAVTGQCEFCVDEEVAARGGDSSLNVFGAASYESQCNENPDEYAVLKQAILALHTVPAESFIGDEDSWEQFSTHRPILGEKSVFIYKPSIYKHDDFTKTGSGQT
jgi:hypothetical protein